MSSIFWTIFWTKFVLADKVFCKHLHLVISQLLDKIFQPFKEQKWCPSLGAPNFGVNSECFAQLLRIRSKTPNFGVTKNSGYSLGNRLEVFRLLQRFNKFLWKIVKPKCDFGALQQLRGNQWIGFFCVVSTAKRNWRQLFIVLSWCRLPRLDPRPDYDEPSMKFDTGAARLPPHPTKSYTV